MPKIIYPSDARDYLIKLYESGKLHRYLAGGSGYVLDARISPPIRGSVRKMSGVLYDKYICPWLSSWETSMFRPYIKNKKGNTDVFALYDRLTIAYPETVFKLLGKDYELARFNHYILVMKLSVPQLVPLMYQSKKFREWVYDLYDIVSSNVRMQISREQIACLILRGIIARCISVPTDVEYARNILLPYLDTKFLERNMGRIRMIYNVVSGDTAGNIKELTAKLNIRFGILVYPVYTPQDGVINMEIEHIEKLITEHSIQRLLISENDKPIRTLSFHIPVICGVGWQVVQLMEQLSALSQIKDLYYWGDCDVDGYRMLGKVRQYRPDILSVCMGYDVVLKVPVEYQVKDSRQGNAKHIDGLDSNETSGYLYVSKLNDRIEQEHIPPHIVEQEFLKHNI